MRLLLVGLIGMSYMTAQHQTIYEDTRVRIVEVQIGPGGSAPAHRHDTDHVWVADAGIHFSRASTTRIERNDEVIVELLRQQTNPRNVCGEVVPGEYLHCHEPGAEWLGANLQMQFETDQTHVGILQIAPRATLAIPPAEVPPLLIALDGAEAEVVTRANGSPAGSGSRRKVKAADVVRSPADVVSEIRNTSNTVARFLVVEFGGPGE